MMDWGISLSHFPKIERHLSSKNCPSLVKLVYVHTVHAVVCVNVADCKGATGS